MTGFSPVLPVNLDVVSEQPGMVTFPSKGAGVIWNEMGWDNHPPSWTLRFAQPWPWSLAQWRSWACQKREDCEEIRQPKTISNFVPYPSVRMRLDDDFLESSRNWLRFQVGFLKTTQGTITMNVHVCISSHHAKRRISPMFQSESLSARYLQRVLARQLD